MDKHRKLRIVFVYCNADPWIMPICQDVERACNKLRHELFIIGEGGSQFINRKNYIDTSYLNLHFYIPTIFELLKSKKVDLSEHVNKSYDFLNKQVKDKNISRIDIQKRIELWFAQAAIVFNIVQPDLVIVWNGLLHQRAIYAEAAKFLDIPVCYAEKGMLPESWYIDERGINASSTIAADEQIPEISVDKFTEWKLKLQLINKDGRSAWAQPQRSGVSELRKKLRIKNTQKVVFFPGQVDFDSNIILFSPHFKTTFEALKWLAEGLLKKEFFILAKPHPKGVLTVKDFNRVIGEKGKSLQNINILDAISLSDCVVSINSTVTFEAAIRAKPVLLLGDGILSNKNFVIKYVPGKNAGLQIKECIDSYNRDRDSFWREAMLFAAHLDSEYYAYRREYLGALRIIKYFTQNCIEKKEKIFTVEEIQAFFQGDYFEYVKNLFSGRVLFKVLFEKIKDKILKVI